MSPRADSTEVRASLGWGKRADMVVHHPAPYNAEPDPDALATSGFLTTTDAFYSRNHGTVPEIGRDEWRLRVTGLVDRELELGLHDLRERFEEVTLPATLQCAGNRRAALLAVRPIPGEDPWAAGATSTATWTGVRLADVLAAAGLSPGAAHVELLAPDVAEKAEPTQPYGSSVPVTKATSTEVLLAYGMNGEDLPAVHGGPVRVVVPGWIGARSVKWVQQVVVGREPSANYFQATAYRLLPPEVEAGPGVGVSLGPVALTCAVLVPGHGATVPAGPTGLRGYAFAGERDVVRVDVSLDDGRTWVQADLDDATERWTWRLWSTRVDLAPGEHRIAVRAWDSTAATQPEHAEQVWNPKGYVNSSWDRATVTATGRPHPSAPRPAV